MEHSCFWLRNHCSKLSNLNHFSFSLLHFSLKVCSLLNGHMDLNSHLSISVYPAEWRRSSLEINPVFSLIIQNAVFSPVSILSRMHSTHSFQLHLWLSLVTLDAFTGLSNINFTPITQPCFTQQRFLVRIIYYSCHCLLPTGEITASHY